LSATEDYLGRVHVLIWAITDSLSESERDEVQHLIDHGEPGEGLRSLAWIIVDGDKRVPASIVRGIKDLTEGLVAPEHLPADLDAHALPKPKSTDDLGLVARWREVR